MINVNLVGGKKDPATDKPTDKPTPVVYTKGVRTHTYTGPVDGTLFYGDCLKFLKDVDKNGNRYIADGSVDLIYIDPPFNSNRVYHVIFREPNGKESAAQIKGFDDSWTWCDPVEKQYWTLTQTPGKVADAIVGLERILGKSNMLAYLIMMATRLVEMRRVLKPTGTIYYHCDQTAGHYIKVLMDAVFGVDNFRNEIIWHYRRWSGASSSFQRMHDTIFWYSKSDNYTFTKPFQPYSHPEFIEDTVRGMVDGKLVRLKDDSGNYIKREKENKGVLMHDVWEDINFIAPTASERIGYPTQKPEALLERIIKASSNEGDVVLDCFCGCGTAVVVANRLRRKWIGIDITHLALNLMRHRLGPNAIYKVVGAPEDLAGAKQLAAEDKMQFQHWALGLDNAMSLEGVTKGSDKGIDGKRFFFVPNPDRNEMIIYSVKGGAVNSGDVRDLVGTVSNNKAAIGVLITLEPATKDMRSEAAKAGFYKPNDFAENNFPKIQVLTVDELLAGKKVEWPQYLKDTTLPEVRPDDKKLPAPGNMSLDDVKYKVE